MDLDSVSLGPLAQSRRYFRIPLSPLRIIYLPNTGAINATILVRSGNHKENKVVVGAFGDMQNSV